MGRVFSNVSALSNHKKSDVAVFLGSGQSINAMTPEQWEVIHACDKWTVNNWCYHPTVVPHFYHVELKAYDFGIVQGRLLEKRKEYRNVKFLIPGNKPKLANAIPPECEVFTYDFRARSTKHSKFLDPKDIDANYVIDPKILTKSYDNSITLVIELMYKMGYRAVYLYGVDLQNSYYFWTGGSKKVYGTVHHQTNKEHEGKDPKLPHNTYRVKNFIVDFNSRFMLPAQRAIYVGHTKTALHPEIEFRDILEEKLNGTV
jgi:hypothetical protein